MAASHQFTPKGTLLWVVINGEGREDLQGNPKYQATVRVTEEDAKEFIALVNEVWESSPQSKSKGKKVSPKSVPYKPAQDKDPETGEYVDVPGMIDISAKTGTTFADGKPKVIPVYNAKNVRVNIGDKKIANGSEGRIAGKLAVYEKPGNVGVTFYLDAIKMTKFIEYNAEVDFSAVDDEDEDGWTGEDADVPFQAEEASDKPKYL